MKFAKASQPYHIEILEIDEPQLMKPDDVKVKILYAGINQSDMRIFRMDSDMIIYPSLVNAICTEYSGIITELGTEAKASGLKVGDLVSGFSGTVCGKCFYCRNGHPNHCINLSVDHGTCTEYIIVSWQFIIKLSEPLSAIDGVFTSDFLFCTHTLSKITLSPINNILVFGLSSIALVLIQLLRLYGVNQITVVDPVKEKRELALSLGATYVIDPDKEKTSARVIQFTDNRGYDYVFEMSGKIENLELSTKLCARGGTILFFGAYSLMPPPLISVAELYIKELTVKTFHIGFDIFPACFTMLHRLNLSIINPPIFPMSEVNAAFKAFESGLYPKVLIQIA